MDWGSKGLWAVTTFFNPRRYKTRYANYLSFRNHLDLPLLTVEWSEAGQFQLNPHEADRLVQCSGGDLMWQKERLISIGIKFLPEGCKAVVVIDADLLLPESGWIEQLKTQLNDTPVVQLFREVRHLPPSSLLKDLIMAPPAFASADTPFYLARQSFASVCVNGLGKTSQPTLVLRNTPEHEREVHRLAARPSFGHAWAFRRDWLDCFGLYEHNIAGSGDLAMAMALADRAEEFCRSYPLNQAQQAHYRRWADPVAQASGPGSIGYVDSIALHLFHGHLGRRYYRSRLQVLAESGFDPEYDIMAQFDQPFVWARQSEQIAQLRSFFHSYFCCRAEDGDA